MATHRIRRNPRVVSRALREETVLLHLDSGEYHGLNPWGSLVWELIDGRRTAASLAAELRARIETPPGGIEEDVLGFLERLRERDLILG